MTDKACFKIREHLLDHHFDELEGLEKQRVEAHLENCADCRSVVERLGNAFTAAASWDPEPKPGEIDRLADRLTPYLDQPEPERKLGFAYGIGLALAAGLAMFFFLRRGEEGGSPSVEPLPVDPIAQVKQEPAEEVLRTRPTEHLRVVSSADWNGDVAESNGTTRVTMDRGFAVMAFEGGDGRTLIVKTPDLEVEVIGTRFYVDARPGVPTTVGVVAGKVAVKTKAKRELLVAGTERAYRADGTKDEVHLDRSKPYHSDAFLLDQPDMLARPQPRPKRNRLPRKTKLLPRKEDYVPAARKLTPPEPKTKQTSEVPEPADALTQVERLVRDGDLDAALGLIEDVLATDAGKKEPYQATLRYERARILVKLGKRDQARLEFGRLTAAPAAEIAHQARLSLCELELTEDPCTARACLESIDSRESRELLSRWRLSELDCDQ